MFIEASSIFLLNYKYIFSNSVLYIILTFLKYASSISAHFATRAYNSFLRVVKLNFTIGLLSWKENLLNKRKTSLKP